MPHKYSSHHYIVSFSFPGFIKQNELTLETWTPLPPGVTSCLLLSWYTHISCPQTHTHTHTFPYCFGNLENLWERDNSPLPSHHTAPPKISQPCAQPSNSLGLAHFSRLLSWKMMACQPKELLHSTSITTVCAHWSWFLHTAFYSPLPLQTQQNACL